jgi:hypothetical protein
MPHFTNEIIAFITEPIIVFPPGLPTASNVREKTDEEINF